jgi:hypothetical protein
MSSPTFGEGVEKLRQFKHSLTYHSAQLKIPSVWDEPSYLAASWWSSCVLCFSEEVLVLNRGHYKNVLLTSSMSFLGGSLPPFLELGTENVVVSESIFQYTPLHQFHFLLTE